MGRADGDDLADGRARRHRPARRRRPGRRASGVLPALSVLEMLLHPAEPRRDRQHGPARGRDDRDPAGRAAARGPRLGPGARRPGQAHEPADHRAGVQPRARADPRLGRGERERCSPTTTCRSTDVGFGLSVAHLVAKEVARRRGRRGRRRRARSRTWWAERWRGRYDGVEVATIRVGERDVRYLRRRRLPDPRDVPPARLPRGRRRATGSTCSPPATSATRRRPGSSPTPTRRSTPTRSPAPGAEGDRLIVPVPGRDAVILKGGLRLTVLAGRTLPVPLPLDLLERLRSVTVTESDDERSVFSLVLDAGRSGPLDGGRTRPSSAASPLSAFSRVVLVLTLRRAAAGAVRRDRHRDARWTRRANGGASTLHGHRRGRRQPARSRGARRRAPRARRLPAGADDPRPVRARRGCCRCAVPPPTMSPPLPIDRIPTQHGTDLEHLTALAERHGYVTYVHAGSDSRASAPSTGARRSAAARRRARWPSAMGPDSNVTEVNFRTEATTPTTVNGTVRDRTTGSTTPVTAPAQHAHAARRRAVRGRQRRRRAQPPPARRGQRHGRRAGARAGPGRPPPSDALVAEGKADGGRYGAVAAPARPRRDAWRGRQPRRRLVRAQGRARARARQLRHSRSRSPATGTARLTPGAAEGRRMTCGFFGLYRGRVETNVGPAAARARAGQRAGGLRRRAPRLGRAVHAVRRQPGRQLRAAARRRLGLGPVRARRPRLPGAGRLSVAERASRPRPASSRSR